MEPIATYSEVRFEGSRTFTLLPDKILVCGKMFLQSEFETVIALTKLDPSPEKLRLRSSIFFVSMGVAVLSFIACSILVSGFQMSWEKGAPSLLACVGSANVLLMLATCRKVEYARFKNDGSIVILDIARAGKAAADFDSFIKALTRQIEAASGVA